MGGDRGRQGAGVHDEVRTWGEVERIRRRVEIGLVN